MQGHHIVSGESQQMKLCLKNSQIDSVSQIAGRMNGTMFLHSYNEEDNLVAQQPL